ncbi:T-cell immunomodulatory protein isoform X2 [Oncorhynchus tshawytscha]|uniref:T-cell immunomodulatory protein TIP C2 domain-containing protein n=1 Tax=Oncorhynchus tshawytscha TaxID=74940 RepID=A0A8C8F3T1_ONCTS|nr:T-cell immunomodulatory protein isoform X2 [Oncorhynchus tshawytscha]
MWILFINIFTFTVYFAGKYSASALQDVTTDLFGSENHGTVAAFGDFNSDKQTDIFIIREQSELVIFLADLKAPYFKPKVHITKKDLPVNCIITGVVPGDYDGDSQMDVLLTVQLKTKATSDTMVVVFWGNNQTLDEQVDLNKTFVDQPLIMDFNGDMIPDIFGVSADFSTEVCYLTGRNAVWQPALSSPVKIRIPHSNAFIDLNKDFTADLFLTTQVGNGLGFETWINKDGNFTKTQPGSIPENVKKVGQSSFVDFNGDGFQDHLLPVCLDDACHRSAIYLSKPGEPEWVQVLTDFQRRETLWGFVPPQTTPPAGELHNPITLHLGDYNMDGFPDALVILRNTSGSGQQAFLLENVPCDNASCKDVGRMFRVHWDQSDLGAIPGAAVATFFDIYEDGILDMIVLSKEEGKEGFAIHALKNNFEADAYFVKVIAGQLSQSAHLSLQLPYTVLGLGRSANFLDHLYVGIPRPLGDKDVRKQEWTAIIPNSQLIVIPHPHNEPRSWSAKLYLTPSNIVLLTAIALSGVCVFILVIIGILHWQEKKADDREKRQEAHRFHFDAM